jgi:capsular polysaccharide biosynthesis protein
MFDWRYWRWQITRNLPIAVVVALLVSASGWAILNATPPKYTASSRIVLERQIGIASTYKTQRTSEEVQHLQVVIHAVKAAISGAISDPKFTEGEQSFDMKIESSRDKPTYLLVESTMPNSAAALGLVQSISARAIEVSETAQQQYIANSLNKLRAKLDEGQTRLTQARNSLRAHQNVGPTVEIDDLLEQTSQLRAELQAMTPGTVTNRPALEKLNSELANARGLYSDLHPKVRLIQARIARALTQRPTNLSNEQLRLILQKRLESLGTQIAANKAYQATSHRLELEVANAAAATQGTLNTLSAAELAGETSLMRLKVVQDASLTGRSQEKIRAGLLAAIVLTALFAAGGAIALRVKFDRHLRRPRDLHRTLGLTPFATLPDLGPSLA